MECGSEQWHDMTHVLKDDFGYCVAKGLEGADVKAGGLVRKLLLII